MRSRSTRVVSLAVALGCLAVFASVALADTVTRGQAGADTVCTTGFDFAAVQTGVSGGPSYTVPSGQWTVTSWSAARATADAMNGENGMGPEVTGGREALVVFRPTGTPHQFGIVGSTPSQALTDSLNTFKATINVKGGDLIGFWVQDGTVCARQQANSTTDTVEISLSEVPAAGTSLTMMSLGGPPGYRLNMSVTLKESNKGPSVSASPVVVPEPARIAVCTAAPIQRSDGTLGTFADVLADQYPATDPASPYYGAAPAKYAEGIGLTCDNLPGYSDAGYKVNGDGVRAPAGQEATWPAPYEYFTKPA
jgi:hypothetical protein